MLWAWPRGHIPGLPTPCSSCLATDYISFFIPLGKNQIKHVAKYKNYVGTKQRGYFIKLLLNVVKKNLMLDAVRFVEGIFPNTC